MPEIDRKKYRTYECIITYKNETSHTVELRLESDKDLVETVFNNRITKLSDGNIIYFNSNEILTFKAKEKTDEKRLDR